MKFIVCDNYNELSEKAANIFADTVKSDPKCTLGLATGSTPIGTYEKLVEYYNDGKLDFSGVTTFNLDEYYPISNIDSQSYHYFMQINLFSHINIKSENINIPDGSVDNPLTCCRKYDEKIEKNGGIDLMLLGIGANGHIGFNEPSENLVAGTHRVKLTESTIEANSRFFDSPDEVPKYAVSMGMASIIAYSKRIVLLASGVDKFPAVSRLVDDKITTHVPATLLKVHPDVAVICDKAAYCGG